MKKDSLKKRAETYIRRKRNPVRLGDLRKAIGLKSDRTSELREVLKEEDLFFRVGSGWYVRDADLKIMVRFCPNCGHRKVRYEGGFYTCPNCEIKFHFTWLM